MEPLLLQLGKVCRHLLKACAKGKRSPRDVTPSDTHNYSSTTHRVLSPERGSGPRFSIPFFQGVSYDATFESMEVPESVKQLRNEILNKRGARQDDIEFTFTKGKWSHLGEATLMNRIKSHPDVGEKWVRSLLENDSCGPANVDARRSTLIF